MPGDTRDYAAMTTPVTSAQVAKAWVRPDRSFAAVSWSRRPGKTLATWVMSGKEALNLPRRLEPLHDPLLSSGRLMGVFGPVIEALVLPMLDPGHDLPLGSGVALQLVGDEQTRGSTLLLEELAEQAFGSLLVAPALDENIENEAVLVDGTPEPMLLPGEADDHLIEVPFVATARRSPTDAVGEFPAEFEAPLPDRLVRHRDAAGGQHLLDHAQAQREPKIQPDRVADDLSGVAMAGVNRVSRRPHPARLPDQPGSYQACFPPT